MIENVSRLIAHVRDVAGIDGLVVLDDEDNPVDGRTFISSLNGEKNIEEFNIAIKGTYNYSDAIRFIKERTGLKNIEFRDSDGNRINGNSNIGKQR